ncbi:hypothetical protein [Amycolatopsis sp. NPDC059657]|uniref:hypothetical protein n=1 Tax=Amycolatopsis sp. NPDC059657 TaxID=3346899 RepID=UPI00366FF1EB
MTFKDLVKEWETSYREYAAVSEIVGASEVEVSGGARAMASTAWNVSQAWHAIAAAHGLPWWAIAAVESAAQAFEEISREWDERAENSETQGRQRNVVQCEVDRGVQRHGGHAESGRERQSGRIGADTRSGQRGYVSSQRSDSVAGVRALPSPTPRRR